MRRGDVVAQSDCAPKSHVKDAGDLQMFERSIPSDS